MEVELHGHAISAEMVRFHGEGQTRPLRLL